MSQKVLGLMQSILNCRQRTRTVFDPLTLFRWSLFDDKPLWEAVAFCMQDLRTNSSLDQLRRERQLRSQERNISIRWGYNHKHLGLKKR